MAQVLIAFPVPPTLCLAISSAITLARFLAPSTVFRVNEAELRRRMLQSRGRGFLTQFLKCHPSRKNISLSSPV